MPLMKEVMHWLLWTLQDGALQSSSIFRHLHGVSQFWIQACTQWALGRKVSASMGNRKCCDMLPYHHCQPTAFSADSISFLTEDGFGWKIVTSTFGTAPIRAFRLGSWPYSIRFSNLRHSAWPGFKSNLPKLLRSGNSLWLNRGEGVLNDLASLATCIAMSSFWCQPNGFPRGSKWWKNAKKQSNGSPIVGRTAAGFLPTFLDLILFDKLLVVAIAPAAFREDTVKVLCGHLFRSTVYKHVLSIGPPQIGLLFRQLVRTQAMLKHRLLWLPKEGVSEVPLS